MVEQHMEENEEGVAEVFAKGSWELIDLQLALKMPKTRDMRCPECHGKVRAYNTGVDGSRAHMEHAARNRGCTRGDCFEGTRAMHPNALV